MSEPACPPTLLLLTQVKIRDPKISCHNYQLFNSLFLCPVTALYGPTDEQGGEGVRETQHHQAQQEGDSRDHQDRPPAQEVGHPASYHTASHSRYRPAGGWRMILDPWGNKLQSMEIPNENIVNRKGQDDIQYHNWQKY